MRAFEAEPSQPSTQGKARFRSFSNPRILLPLLLVVGLYWSVVWAYLDRPRLQAGFGGIGDTIPVRQNDFANVQVRGGRFRAELDRQLNSAEFMAALSALDARQPRLLRQRTRVSVRSATPGGLDVQTFVAEASTMVSDAFEGEAVAIIVGESEESDLYLMYLYPRSYSVHRPDNEWIRWLQARLPGMPDEARLAREAEEGNDTVKNDIRRLLQDTVRDCGLSCKQQPTPPAR